MSPGRREPSFWPIALSPCPTAFVPALRPFRPARARALRTIPTARATACRVQPYFLKMFLTRSREGRASSLSWICGSNLSISSSLSAIRASATCLSLEAAFSSSTTSWSSSFSRLNVSYRSFSSSKGFCSVKACFGSGHVLFLGLQLSL